MKHETSINHENGNDANRLLAAVAHQKIDRNPKSMNKKKLVITISLSIKDSAGLVSNPEGVLDSTINDIIAKVSDVVSKTREDYVNIAVDNISNLNALK